MRYHYVYLSFDSKGLSYIGSRTTPNNVLPVNDPYLGSYSDKNYHPEYKLILGVYSTRKEAYEKEAELHKTLEVDSNPCFSNRCQQTPTGFFYRKGFPGDKNPSKRPEVRLKISNSHKARIAREKEEGTYINPMHTKAAKEKLSKTMKGRKVDWGHKVSKTILEKNLKNPPKPYLNPFVLGNPKSIEIWCDADILYKHYLTCLHKVTPSKLAKLHKKEYKRHSYLILLREFKKGWVPSLDKDWLKFKDENQTQIKSD